MPSFQEEKTQSHRHGKLIYRWQNYLPPAKDVLRRTKENHWPRERNPDCLGVTAFKALEPNISDGLSRLRRDQSVGPAMALDDDQPNINQQPSTHDSWMWMVPTNIVIAQSGGGCFQQRWEKWKIQQRCYSVCLGDGHHGYSLLTHSWIKSCNWQEKAMIGARINPG